MYHAWYGHYDDLMQILVYCAWCTRRFYQSEMEHDTYGTENWYSAYCTGNYINLHAIDLVMRNYIVKAIIQLSSNESTLRSAVLNKFDLVLVQIVKKDWPQYWPSFIQEIVDSSVSNMNLCENNMRILRYLRYILTAFNLQENIRLILN